MLNNIKASVNLKMKDMQIKDTDTFDFQEYIELYVEGAGKDLNKESFNNMDTLDWQDVNKLRKGQEFAKSYYSSLSYCELISIYMLFSHERSLRSLIFTRKSDEIESAFKRYMSTTHRVKSWYEDDLLNPASSARKHFQVVNSYHLRISTKLNSITEEEFMKQSNLDPEKMESDNNCHNRIKILCENDNEINDNRLVREIETCKHFTQTHLAMTQFGFMGLLVLNPEKFGIYNTDGLDSFIHLWKYIGSQIGIEDKYNLCTGSLDEVRKKCKALLEFIIKPCMRQVNSTWEHMSICVLEAFNSVTKALVFETTLVWLLDCIDVECESFYNSIKFKSKLAYYSTVFLFKNVIPIKWARNIINFLLEYLLEKEKKFS